MNIHLLFCFEKQDNEPKKGRRRIDYIIFFFLSIYVDRGWFLVKKYVIIQLRAKMRKNEIDESSSLFSLDLKVRFPVQKSKNVPKTS